MEGSRRVAAAAYGVVFLALAWVADPLANAVFDTFNREPEALAILRAHADEPSSAVQPVERPALVVLLDGVRVDEAEHLPALQRLRSSAAFAVVEIGGASFSMPYYHAFLTGVPADGSGVRANYDDQPAVLDSLADRVRHAGGHVAWIAEDLDWIAVMHARNGDLIETGADALEQPLDALLDAVRRAEGPALAVVHVLAVDETAHDFGLDSPEHREALELADSIVSRADRAAEAGGMVFLVVSDHGHIDGGGHGGDEESVRLAPQFLRAPGLAPTSISRRLPAEEVAPTLAAWMGVSAPLSAVVGASPELAPPGYSVPPAVRVRAEQMAAATLVDLSRLRRNRLIWLGATLVLGLLLLLATARALGGLDASLAVGPFVWAGSVVLGHLLIIRRPFTMSAFDDIDPHGARLAILGAAAALVAIAATIGVGRLRRRSQHLLRRVQQAAACTGLGSVAVAAISVAWVGGALGPWPLGATEMYGPLLTIVSGLGCCAVCGVALVGSALPRGTR